MAIVGFSMQKIIVERKNSPKGKINIKNNVKIKKVQKSKFNFGDGREALSYSFEFSVLYEPNVGSITISGDVINLVDAKVSKDVLSKWKKEKKVDAVMLAPVLNAVLQRCNIQALILSRDINLPAPIPLPSVSKKDAANFMK